MDTDHNKMVYNVIIMFLCGMCGMQTQQKLLECSNMFSLQMKFCFIPK